MTPKPTGWDNGLCQDYDRGLGSWFAHRLNARWEVRQLASEIEEKRKNHGEDTELAEDSDVHPYKD